MTEICFSPGLGAADVATALCSLSPRLAPDTPAMGIGGRGALDAGEAVFASAAIMRLFGVSGLPELSGAIGVSDGAAARLRQLSQTLPLNGPARLERLRFEGVKRPIIFLCRRLGVAGAPPLFLAAALDMPHDLRGSVAAPPEAPAEISSVGRPDRGGPARFLWRTDAEDRLIEVGPRLPEAIGEPKAELLGQKLARLVAGFDADKGMELARLFEARESWSGLDLAWPVAGEDFIAPVTIAGSPVFDHRRQLLGFRGFGLIHPRRAAAPDSRIPESKIIVLRSPLEAGAGPSAPQGPEQGADDASISGSRARLADLASRLEQEWPAPPRANPRQSAAEPDPLPNGAKAAFDVLPIGVLVCGNGAALFANRFLLDLLGCADFASAKFREAIQPVMTRPASAEYLELRDGSGRAVRLRVARAPLPHGPEWLEAISLAPQPSAARSGAEPELKRLQREARELNAILDTAMEGVAVIDSAGRIKSLNRSGEALFCYDKAEVAGEPFTVLVAPESRERALAYFEGLKSNGVAEVFNDGREILGLTRQGGQIPIFMTLGKIGSSAASGIDQRYCALLRDMTHWKKVERELDDARREAERASALKSDFLAKVSHEIRTPLNAIIGFAEVIMEERFGPIGNARYKDYLKDIHSSGSLVMSLVNDLLDLSKIEAGKMDLSFEAVDANRIVTECVSIMQPQASSARVVIRLSLAPQLPHIFADERSVRQIVLNLLSNAIKFTQGGGQVIVSTALNDENCAALRIRDTGVGMSEGDLKVALEPFGQAPRARGSGGTGLGLPLTKALVEANRASFSIKSKVQDGTLVEVAFLPARVVAAENGARHGPQR
ncbi:PAS/PAC sensor signal transduction histidine kinase [Methylocella silvestris BL2]|uniref:histidine kinase n=1 Tax=Methylocella silvestris (strain DSM 15510 / CIP 108128 / LMG 27833 / NCIMB 13906 / BL2) TaxID=395965 RepID=B8ETL1_METSB|nr:ATP-binding protein [Methylocella silvestris]ACK52363.1 PAS/PAC sensor signal transduction histidine kinase [Methylocella silvestris BL2]